MLPVGLKDQVVLPTLPLKRKWVVNQVPSALHGLATRSLCGRHGSFSRVSAGPCRCGGIGRGRLTGERKVVLVPEVQVGDTEGPCHPTTRERVIEFDGMVHCPKGVTCKGIHVPFIHLYPMHYLPVLGMGESNCGVAHQTHHNHPSDMTLVVLVGDERVVVQISHEEGGVGVPIDAPILIAPERSNGRVYRVYTGLRGQQAQ